VRFVAGQILLEEDDVTEAIRAEDISRGASVVAALPLVRAALLDRQRAFRVAPGLVADGRDMGSVVFPDAAVKIFLTASVAARAERRYKQLIAKGVGANLSTLSQELRERDERGCKPRDGAVCRLPDAELLDTSDLSIEASVQAALDLARAGLRKDMV